MDRRLLFPIAAVTAWAQQPSPEAAKAEAALRARAEQFFQLQVDRKFRQAESIVAEDSKDEYYNANKLNIKGFTIQKIELLDGAAKAKVAIKARVTLTVPGFGVLDLDSPSTSTWKLENGEWVYYVDPEAALQTPFGKLNPGSSGAGTSSGPRLFGGRGPMAASALKDQLKIDRNSVVLTADSPQQTVTISNELPGPVDLRVPEGQAQGFKVKIGKDHLERGERTDLQFTATDLKPGEQVVSVLVAPLNTQLDIQVITK
jgi:hypothetical protein